MVCHKHLSFPKPSHPSRFRDKERPVLINNGTYFAFTEERLHAMVDSASDLGVELVWMMGGLQRDGDDSSGRLVYHKTALPHGLKGLANFIVRRSLDSWFEPEMISEDLSSIGNTLTLLSIHQDAKSYGRNQYVLRYVSFGCTRPYTIKW